jgi:hypothetical protein
MPRDFTFESRAFASESPATNARRSRPSAVATTRDSFSLSEAPGYNQTPRGSRREGRGRNICRRSGLGGWFESSSEKSSWGVERGRAPL